MLGVPTVWNNSIDYLSLCPDVRAMVLASNAFSIFPEFVRTKWVQGLTELGKDINYGIRPHRYDWDVLLVLDACRWDLFEEFAPGHDVYERFQTVEPVYSCASSSDEWLDKSFQQAPDSFVSDVCYVTANAYTHQIDIDRFHAVEDVWRYARDPGSGTTFPGPVTNEAVRKRRKHPDRKLVIHYFQPHAPFLHCLNRYQQGGDIQHVWEGIRTGEFDREEVWHDYGENLLAVLDDVERVFEEVDGRIVVTSDHANLMGEWGLYGHPSYVPSPTLKRVPWAVGTGDGAHDYPLKDQSEIETQRTDKPSISEHLRQLGYVE